MNLPILDGIDPNLVFFACLMVGGAFWFWVYSKYLDVRSEEAARDRMTEPQKEPIVVEGTHPVPFVRRQAEYRLHRINPVKMIEISTPVNDSFVERAYSEKRSLAEGNQ